ncbi:hypothetical protein V8F20_003355 [Naviculisporaceae sp. PSN 640]
MKSISVAISTMQTSQPLLRVRQVIALLFLSWTSRFARLVFAQPTSFHSLLPPEKLRDFSSSSTKSNRRTFGTDHFLFHQSALGGQAKIHTEDIQHSSITTHLSRNTGEKPSDDCSLHSVNRPNDSIPQPASQLTCPIE